MKKVLALVLSFCVWCVCFESSYAVESEGQLGIFYSTRDLEGLSWLKRLLSDVSLEGYGGEFVTVDNENSFSHIPVRHCFLIFGRQLAKTADNLLIEVFAAIGVSRVQRGEEVTKVMEVGDETEWLFDLKERSKFRISCTPFVLEGMPLLVKGNDSAVLATEDNVIEIWNKCRVAFNNRLKRVKGVRLPEGQYVSTLNGEAENDFIEVKDEKGNGYCYDPEEYNGVLNNCCTVAFESLRQVVAENKDFDLNPNLRHINKRDYNVCGVLSIPFDSSDDSVWGTVTGVGRCLLDYIFCILKLGVHEAGSAQLEKYHKSLKETEGRVIARTFQRYQRYFGMDKDEATQIIRKIDAKQLFAKASELPCSRKIATIVKSVFINIAVKALGTHPRSFLFWLFYLVGGY